MKALLSLSTTLMYKSQPMEKLNVSQAQTSLTTIRIESDVAFWLKIMVLHIMQDEYFIILGEGGFNNLGGSSCYEYSKIFILHNM